MKITGPNPLRPAGPARRSERSGGRPGEFARALGDTEESGETSHVHGSAPVSGVDALLSIQEVGDFRESGGGAKAKARAAALLDRLDDLKLGLLAGELPRERLDDLRQLVDSERGRTEDPALNEVLDEIDLRVQVELAKLSAEG
jgi:hypothetical protein